MKARDLPVLIVCRDKVDPLRKLVNWLETAGHTRIVFVDNASTYGPLLDYFDASPHDVVRRQTNDGPRAAIWASGLLDQLAIRSDYIVTDPDVVPDPSAPYDATEYFGWILDRYPDYIKAGFGLRIDDLPDHYNAKENAIRWETKYWQRPLSKGLYHAAIDTTFARYRSGSSFAFGPAIRTGPPYVARHLPWYTDSKNLSAEDVYYRRHSRTDVTNWDVSGAGRESTTANLSLARKIKWRLHVAMKVTVDPRVGSKYCRKESDAAP